MSVFQGWIIKNAAIRKMDVHLLRTRIGTKLLGLFICSGSSMKKGCEVKICSYTHKRNLCLDPSNFYMGGPAYVTPRLSAVRLRHSTRPAAMLQRLCATMDLTVHGLDQMHLRRIRIKCVHVVTRSRRGC